MTRLSKIMLEEIGANRIKRLIYAGVTALLTLVSTYFSTFLWKTAGIMYPAFATTPRPNRADVAIPIAPLLGHGYCCRCGNLVGEVLPLETKGNVDESNHDRNLDEWPDDGSKSCA